MPSLQLTKRIEVRRDKIFEDVIELYSKSPEIVDNEISVKFQGEEGVDLGGLVRDFFSAFWDKAYQKMFDGSALLTPVSDPTMDMNNFTVLGRVLSHGFLCSGFLPTRIAYPVLAFVLLGTDTSLPQRLFVECLCDFLSIIDRKIISDALKVKEFGQDVKTSLINILSRFGCRDVPTPANIRQILCGIAQHLFKSQPFATICVMNAAIPTKHVQFWHAFDCNELYAAYDALTANPSKLLKKIREPEFKNPNEQHIFTYFQQYIGQMNADDAKRVVRFITGSSVLTSEDIRVEFNALSRIARRPIAHTCSNTLELSCTYKTFLEFVEEFSTLLSNEEYCWSMDSV